MVVHGQTYACMHGTIIIYIAIGSCTAESAKKSGMLYICISGEFAQAGENMVFKY